MSTEPETWPDGGGEREMTPKRRRFVEEYLLDLNATQAAIRAGYAESGARTEGARLLADADIADAIAAAQAARSARTSITADMVLAELAKVGFANLSDVTNWGIKEIAFGYTEDGKRLPVEDIGDAAVVRYVQAPFVEPIDRDNLDASIKAAVAEVSLGREGFKIKMHDKVAALEKIGKHLGMFTERHEHSGPDGAPLMAPMMFRPRKAKPVEDDAAAD